MMKTIRTLSVIAAVFAGLHAQAQGPSAPPPAPVQEDLDVKPAMAAATDWLAEVDAGRYATSWERAATFFRESVTRAQWEKAVVDVRGTLGPLVGRKLASALYTRALPGAPPGEYVVIQYHARYVNRPMVTETVTPMRDKDGNWRVSGYFVR
jgi:hypothetical protein